ncbi:hypothetical protein [Enterocloster lavalensis]|uniref:hypothetical protein n=1 Tax=Enterocloster lavalensis TaxID=460384 RepID=UPI00266531A4|nr:hypothetical protein [Enterocloster lavalensis]
MGSFETELTPARAKQRAKEHWDWWRLVLDAGMDFNTVFYQMSPAEVVEANAAFDLLIGLRKKAAKK